MPAISNEIFPTSDLSSTLNTETVPPISADTQSLLPSAVNSAWRGRWSTSELCSSASSLTLIQCTKFVVSEVVIAIFPSGLTAMPSGSIPTSICATTVRSFTFTTVVIASSSFAINSNSSLGCNANCSGSSPEGSSCRILWVFASMT